MKTARPIISWTAALIFACAAVWASAAESYPARPVRMVIPFAAGGPADFVGRLFAQHLTDLWGRQVVTDNRSGASGIIGTEIAIRSNPDGYTLLFGSTSTFAVNLVLIKKLPYDVFRDLQLIGLVANAPHVLAVRANLPVKDVKELVALAKKEPGKLKFASAGPGTIVHMAGELFKYHAGIDILHVPYKGGAPATVGLLAGEVDMLVNDLSAVLQHVKSGRLRALAAAHTKRLAPLPDVPTFAELGMPGIVSSTWWGIAVPVKTPREIVARVAAAHDKVLGRKEYTERLAELAMEPLVLTREETNAFIKREIEKWRNVAKVANVRID
ncbi:MAG TPA: tripartite tricarboxylate transporter substrate binding protein [Burkholderiales bacterium]|nr:tripartite tricarboxylate transporter substrate binding protein [Burkholderiales bacterium]